MKKMHFLLGQNIEGFESVSGLLMVGSGVVWKKGSGFFSEKLDPDPCKVHRIRYPITNKSI